MIHIMESKQSEERSEMIDVILRNMIDIGLEVLGCAGDVKDYRVKLYINFKFFKFFKS